MHDRTNPSFTGHVEYLCISVVCSNLAKEVTGCLWPYVGGLHVSICPDWHRVAPYHSYICIFIFPYLIYNLEYRSLSRVTWISTPLRRTPSPSHFCGLRWSQTHIVNQILTHIHPHLCILYMAPSYPAKAIFLLNKPGQQTKSNYVGQLPPGSG